MDRIAEIKDRLERELSPTYIDIIDESHLHAEHAGAASGAGHFSVTVVSDKFTDQSAIERHRMIYQAVDDLMRTEIHALSINALAPYEQAPNGKTPEET